MSRFGTHYQVARPTGRCAESGEPLEPGSICIATLCEREDDEGFDRFDFSLDSWERGARPPRLFSSWRVQVHPPQEKRGLLVDDEVLLDLFERLEGDERPQRVAFRFVLGLVLLRKKLLRFAGRDAAGGREFWLVRLRGSEADDPPIRLPNPLLSDDDVRELTAQLGEILQSEL